MLMTVVLLALEIVTAAYSIEEEPGIEPLTLEGWKELEEADALLVSEVRALVSVLAMLLVPVPVSVSVVYCVEVSPLMV